MKNFRTTLSRVCDPVVLALVFATASAVYAEDHFYQQHIHCNSALPRTLLQLVTPLS